MICCTGSWSQLIDWLDMIWVADIVLALTTVSCATCAYSIHLVIWQGSFQTSGLLLCSAWFSRPQAQCDYPGGRINSPPNSPSTKLPAAEGSGNAFPASLLLWPHGGYATSTIKKKILCILQRSGPILWIRESLKASTCEGHDDHLINWSAISENVWFMVIT